MAVARCTIFSFFFRSFCAKPTAQVIYSSNFCKYAKIQNTTLCAVGAVGMLGGGLNYFPVFYRAIVLIQLWAVGVLCSS